MRESCSHPSQPLNIRIPVCLNNRLDLAVIRRRQETGKRITRTALLVEILDGALPPSHVEHQEAV